MIKNLFIPVLQGIMTEKVISKRIQWHKDSPETTYLHSTSLKPYSTSESTCYLARVVERNKFIKTKVLQTAHLKRAGDMVMGLGQQMYSSTKEEEGCTRLPVKITHDDVFYYSRPKLTQSSQV